MLVNQAILDTYNTETTLFAPTEIKYGAHSCLRSSIDLLLLLHYYNANNGLDMLPLSLVRVYPIRTSRTSINLRINNRMMHQQLPVFA